MVVPEIDESAALYQSPHQSPIKSNYQITNQKPEWGKLLIIIGIATTFGTSVPVGYNIGVINAPADYIKEWTNSTILNRFGTVLNDSQLSILWSSIVSIFLIGGAIGSLGGAWFADKFGRKGSLIICQLLFVLAAILFFVCRLINSIELLLIGRLIVGLASGLTTSTVPMYLSELAPLALRGSLGVLCSMGVTGGVVVGQIASLQQCFGTEDLWHFALSAYILLVIICGLFDPIFPESPKYLYVIAKEKIRARQALISLRGSKTNTMIIDQELAGIEEEDRINKSQVRTIWSVVIDKKLLLPLVLVCALQGGQQLSGINAVFYYSVTIFTSAGLTNENAKWANLGAGCLNLFIACFSPILMTKINRRPLILLSCFISAIFLTLLIFVVHFIDLAQWLSYACIFCVFGYIIAYQIGLGPIPYFIGTELFEVGPRPAAMALGSLSSWTCNFIIGMTFPVLQAAWGAFVFIPFAIVCFGLVALLKYYLPETRNREPSEFIPLISNGFRSKPMVPTS